MFEHALKTWGDKMTKAEIDDIFGEFEIDEDYMIKTKDVIGLFVSVKEEPKVEDPAPVEEAPEAEPGRTPTPRRRRRRRRRPPSNCHLQTIEVVKKMLKTFLDLRALKITVILTSLSNSH